VHTLWDREVLPMSIPKWQASINYLYPINDEMPLHPGRMEVVLLDDHVAAVAAAEQRGRDSMHAYLLADDENSYAAGYRLAVSEMNDLLDEMKNPNG